MTRSQILTLTGFALLGALVVWQFRRLSEMERAAAALQARAVETAVPPEKSGPGEWPDRNRPGKNGGPRGDQSGPEGTHKPRDEAREVRFREMREMDRKQRQDAKILALTTKLNLTPDQQATIRAALEKGSQERDALREAGFARRQEGTRETEEARRAEMAKLAAVDAAQEQAITAGLSAEQLAAYSGYQTEQKQNTIENRANQQLGDLLTRFSLTEDQKDAAFQFFAKQEEEYGFEPDRVAAMGGDFMSLFEQRQKNALEALKQILTPEQYELYRAQQEQRSTTFRNLIPGAPPPGRE